MEKRIWGLYVPKILRDKNWYDAERLYPARNVKRINADTDNADTNIALKQMQKRADGIRMLQHMLGRYSDDPTYIPSVRIKLVNERGRKCQGILTRMDTYLSFVYIRGNATHSIEFEWNQIQDVDHNILPDGNGRMQVTYDRNA